MTDPLTLGLLSLAAAGTVGAGVGAWWLRRRHQRDVVEAFRERAVELGLTLTTAGDRAHGVVEGRRVSLWREARMDVDESGRRKIHETWLAVHLPKSLQIDTPDRLAALPERGELTLESALSRQPPSGSRRAAKLRLDHELNRRISARTAFGWLLVILDRELCATRDGVPASEDECAEMLEGLFALTNEVLRARTDAETSRDRLAIAPFREAALAVGLDVASAPPRVLGTYQGLPVEAHPEDGSRDVRGCFTVRLELPQRTTAHVGLERGAVALRCGGDFRACAEVAPLASWRVRPFGVAEPRWLRAGPLQAALSAAPPELRCLVIDGARLQVGFTERSPSQLGDALEAAQALARAIEVSQGTGSPYRS